jgi:hypothetical protein
MFYLVLTVVGNLASILSWWHSRWHSSTPLHLPLRRRRRRRSKSLTKKSQRKTRTLAPVSPRKTPTRKQSKFLGTTNNFALESDILNDDLFLFFWVFALSLRPKSDILKDPPSEANSIQSANATTKTSETNHTSRYSEIERKY